MESAVERDAVLIIDDDPDFREIVRTVLEEQGVAVFEAEACCEGLSILNRAHDRLRMVLVDYWMPGMSPQECSMCLKKRAGDIPIVLVTAAANPAARAAELGLSRWLSKPFELAQLSRLVRGSK